MADNLRKYTTQEVLNKVYTDSSGITIGLNSQSSKETLNAVLDSSNNRLQVAMAGGTISGDVTISGDLTVEGGGGLAFDEIIEGTLSVESNSADSTIFLIKASDGIQGLRVDESSGGDVNLIMRDTSGNADIVFHPGANSYFNNNGNFGIGTSSPGRSLEISGTAANSEATRPGIEISSFSDADDASTSAGVLKFHKSANDTLNTYGAGSHTAAGEVVGRIESWGVSNDSDGSSDVEKLSAYIEFAGDAVAREGTSPHKITFATSGNHNNDAPRVAMTITDDQDVHIPAGILKISNSVDNDQTENILLYARDTARFSGTVFPGVLETVGCNTLEIGTAASQPIHFATNATVRMTIDSSGRVIIGHTANVALGTTDPSLQVLGTSEDASQISIGRFSADDTAPKINLIKGRGGIGANTIVTDNDNLGTINFRGADGSDLDTIGASIEARVNGTPGANDLPTELIFSTTADGAATPTERMRIDADGLSSLSYTSSQTNQTRAVIELKHTTNGNMTDGFGSSINFNIKDATSSTATIAKISGVRDGGDAQGALTFNTLFGGTMTERMRITTTGDVHFGSDNYDPLIQDGSGVAAGSVGYSFKADTDTGMSSGDSSNVLMLVTGGSAAMVLTPTSRICLSNNDNNSNNTVFGKSAFNTSTDNASDKNIVIGELAMGTGSVAGASRNVAIGYSAFTDATSGINNVAIGHNSALNLTNGNSNVVIGREAFQTSTGGENCIVIGTNAMQSANHSSNDGSVAIGKLALSDKNLASGAQFTGATTAIGYKALTALTSGAGNTAIGHNALLVNQTGASNTVIGYETANNTTGSQNVVVGSDSGKGIGSAGNNTYVGYAVATNTSSSGNSNTLIGSAVASGGALTGSNNVGVGRNALLASTSGHSNVAIGMSAGASIVDATYNTAVGHNAGDGTVDGGRNVSLGAFSHGNADTGDKNIAIGYQSGYVMTGSNNITIGNQCGDSITSGNHNTLIGDEADVDTATDSYQTAIGSYGIVKYITAVFEFAAGHATLHGAISMVSRIPARAIVTEAAVIVQDLSSNSTHNLELILSTDATKTVDSALTTSGITNPVLVGNSAAATYAQDSVTAMGTSNHIDAGTSSGVSGTVYYNKPTTTIGHASSDMYAWIANGDGSSNSDSSSSVKVRVKIGYIAL